MRIAPFIVSLLVVSGCSTLETALPPEVRYGQLYALEEALTHAAARCDDTVTTHRAAYWAQSTAMNIADHSRYLDEGSNALQSARRLVSELGQLRVPAPDDITTCQQYANAAATTREVLASLTHGQ